jgi:hypothetical protein
LNALDIIEQVRAHDAELVLEDDQLVIHGHGERLPDDLYAELREHKAEVMVALGAPLDRTVAGILAELRPNLPEPLRTLPDASLLAMVNWTLIHAWEKTIRQAHLKHEAER